MKRSLTILSLFGMMLVAQTVHAGCPLSGGGGGYRPITSYRPAYQPATYQPVYQSSIQPTYPQVRTVQPIYESNLDVPPPIPIPTTSRVRAPKVKPVAVNPVEVASKAYREGNFGTAKRIADKLVAEDKKNADALQFRSLVHLAMGDLDAAAADVYDSVLSKQRLWTLDAIATLHSKPEPYLQRLSNLRTMRLKGKTAVSRDFLLAYHDALAGRFELSAKSLRSVQKVMPKDPVAKLLLQVVEQQLAKTKVTKAVSG